ncbi:hypothetical protein IscW_ISCW022318 [Ixodes scapularis]|uniref:Uncharacterized protein n=1 Tax=Ixodes scapularis TaxID=6945 RepID=B7QDP9_IXOSC|nr:hypothetical protein IscW_ISCW022318 [Ixodes scapularis]|eukprot:XP_002413663.1 hypothetical protein IscW_ISCW022318 [Ixodes scapularis]
MRGSKAHLEGEPGVVRQVSVGGGGARILRRGLLGRPDGLAPDTAQVSAVGLGPLLRVRVVMVAPGTPRGAEPPPCKADGVTAADGMATAIEVADADADDDDGGADVCPSPSGTPVEARRSESLCS